MISGYCQDYFGIWPRDLVGIWSESGRDDVGLWSGSGRDMLGMMSGYGRDTVEI